MDAAIATADRRQDRGHDKRAILRAVALFLSVIIPIADRQHALASVESAVDAGRPVPLDIESDPFHAGDNPQSFRFKHQLMIIGRDGDKLEIYNPWGYTTWVNSSDFVNSHLCGVTNTWQNMRIPAGVDLPG